MKSIKHKIITIGLLSLSLIGSISAQDVSVKATLDSTMMIIGNQSKLTLELIKSNDADINFPIILDTIIDKVEVISVGKIDTNNVSDSRQQLIQELVITSFDSGFYYIPPFEFEINNGGGIIESNPLALKIYTYQIDSIAGIFDIKPVKKIKFKFSEAVPYIMWVLIAAIIVLIAVALYYKYKKKQPLFSAPEKPKEPAYITAFRDLERIRAEKLWQKEQEKKYFTELTDTLRSYLEGRYGVLAMEQTSEEILTEIKTVVSKEQYGKIETILKLSDLVKFAKMRPLLDESERCIKDVYAFVDETKFIPEEITEDKENNNNETEAIKQDK